VRALTGSTHLAAVIGSPVRHSLSPAIHNAAFRAVGLDWAFVAFEVAPGQVVPALAGMRALGIEGLSVTMPHKADVAAAVDDLTPAAARLRAVNCVARHGDRLVGHNTDGDGFIDALAADTGMAVAGRRCVVVGAGGAARALVGALADHGAAEVIVVNRSQGPALEAAALAGDRGRVGVDGDLRRADLIVQATSVGMGATQGQLPFDPELLHSDQVVVDIIVHPAETELVLEARRRGALATGGLGMLVHQAARAFTLWTGLAAPVDVMAEAVRAARPG